MVRILMLAGPPDRLCVRMVLPVRIELTTSALPRMRSTTELRQHFRKVAPMAGRPKLSTARQSSGAPDGEARTSAPNGQTARRRAARQSQDTAKRRRAPRRAEGHVQAQARKGLLNPPGRDQQRNKRSVGIRRREKGRAGRSRVLAGANMDVPRGSIGKRWSKVVWPSHPATSSQPADGLPARSALVEPVERAIRPPSGSPACCSM